MAVNAQPSELFDTSWSLGEARGNGHANRECHEVCSWAQALLEEQRAELLETLQAKHTRLITDLRLRLMKFEASDSLPPLSRQVSPYITASQGVAKERSLPFAPVAMPVRLAVPSAVKQPGHQQAPKGVTVCVPAVSDVELYGPPVNRDGSKMTEQASDESHHVQLTQTHSASDDPRRRPSVIKRAVSDAVEVVRSNLASTARPEEKRWSSFLRVSLASLEAPSVASATEAAASCHERMTKLVNSATFELAFGVLIIMNTMVMAAQRQYEGFTNAYTIQYQDSRPAAETWPGAVSVFEAMEWVFGLLFLSELVLKLAVLGRRFFTDTFWNWYDLVIVLAWCLDRLSAISLEINPMLMRLARMARLLRLLRILRWLEIFDPLHLMVKSIRASMTVLMWSLILLVTVIAVVAMIVSQALDPFIQNPENDLEGRILVYESWGSFSRSVETLFEITTANWGPPCRDLMNTVNEWWVVFFLAYKLSVGFAVVQVIMSVFIQQTFKVASRDEEVMLKEKKAAAQAYLKHVERLFEVLDASGDGIITQDEFDEAIRDQRVLTWFQALEVNAAEMSSLFKMLDDGDGMITREEFLRGLKMINGAAKGTDMLLLSRQAAKTHSIVCGIASHVRALQPQTHI